MNYRQHVECIAYSLWIEDGRPDGEQWVNSDCRIKIKDYHWLKATAIADMLAAVDGSDWIHIPIHLKYEFKNAHLAEDDLLVVDLEPRKIIFPDFELRETNE